MTLIFLQTDVTQVINSVYVCVCVCVCMFIEFTCICFPSSHVVLDEIENIVNYFVITSFKPWSVPHLEKYMYIQMLNVTVSTMTRYIIVRHIFTNKTIQNKEFTNISHLSINFDTAIVSCKLNFDIMV